MEEVNKILGEIGGLKAPGISGSRIKKIAEIATKNVTLEEQIVRAILAFCKNLQPSHKIGGLYIFDSVARGYQMNSRKLENTVVNYDDLSKLNVHPGTFVHGILEFNSGIYDVLDNCLSSIDNDEEQREKVSNLIQIWGRSKTFDKNILEQIQNRFYGSGRSYSSAGPSSSSQPSQPSHSNETKADPNAILEMLHQMQSNQSQSESQPQSSQPSQSLPHNPGLPNIPGNPGSISDSRGGNSDVRYNNDYQGSQGGYGASQGGFGGSQGGYGGQSRYGSQGGYGGNDNSYGHGSYGNSGGYQQPGGYQQNSYGNNGYDQGGYGGGGHDDYRSERPNHFDRGRDDYRGGRDYDSRSRSPNGRYGGGRDRNNYGGNSRDRESMNRYRDLSANERRKVDTAESALLNPGERNTPGTLHYRERHVSFDHETLPNDCIKVYSRTLFIGGVTPNMDEAYLATILRPYAEVQSVILNTSKKHAFVKVYSRSEAKKIFASFNTDHQYNLRLRWGVGFGPRDCCNYQNGISIIPLSRLTDADKRWLTTAEWGGTGGQTLVSGMCVDEPDIEIGKGVSSKAISKKMPTDSTRNGPKSTKPGVPDDIYSDPLNESIGDVHVVKKEDNPLLNLFNNNSSSATPVPAVTGYGAPPPAANNGQDSSQGGNPDVAALINSISSFIQK